MNSLSTSEAASIAPYPVFWKGLTRTLIRKGQSNGAGFSLIELLMVISVLIIMMGLAVMGWGRLTRDTADQAAREIAAQLELARSHAVAGGTYVWVCFAESAPDSDDNQLLVAIMESANGRADASPANLNFVGRTANFRGLHVSDHPVAHADALSDANLGSFVVRHGSASIATTTVVRFSPLGEATVSESAPSHQIEIPIRRVTSPEPGPGAWVQVAGLSGSVFTKLP